MPKIIKFDGVTVPQEAIDAGYDVKVTLDMPYQVNMRRSAQKLSPHEPIMFLKKGMYILVKDDGSLHEIPEGIADAFIHCSDVDNA